MAKQRITNRSIGICRILCLWLCCCMCWSANAEIITLRSGKTLRGEVLLQNEEVVILRLSDGSKYQYPVREIVSIEAEETVKQDTEEVRQQKSTSKKAALHIDISGGAAYIPRVGLGGFAAADILVGTHDLMHKQVFLGGGIGYHAVIMPNTVYSFIPVQAATFIPLTTGRHAPVVNMALGYGFAVNEHTKGGICTELGIGWRYHVHKKTALSLSADVQWQQAQTSVTEVIDGNTYSHNAGVNILSMGIKIGLHF